MKRPPRFARRDSRGYCLHMGVSHVGFSSMGISYSGILRLRYFFRCLPLLNSWTRPE
jgi:hypothetical protein